MRRTGVGMDYLVLRKLLSTTSLLAMAATLAACSGEVERFGTPGSGYTSNQNEIFTSSVRSQPSVAPVNQPMPAAVPVGSSSTQPIYRDPAYQANATKQPSYNAPVYSVPASPAPVAQASSVSQSVPVSQQAAPVALTTGSINRSASNTYQSYPSQPMPPMPSGNLQASSGPAYVDVASSSNSGGYSSRTPSSNAAVLNGPPVVVSRFDSLPHAAPRPKSQVASYNPAPNNRYQSVPVSVPTASSSAAPQPETQQSRFSLAKIFSLPKNAPKSKGIDYTSTASIAPPNPIPTGGQAGNVYSDQVRAMSAPAASTQNQARTSGQWTSVGGTMVTVDQGEDLQSLSRRYGVPEKAIADINGRKYVTPGQQVLIPVFQQQGYRSYAAQTQRPQQPVQQKSNAQSSQPMQLASISSSSVQMPYVMRVPKGNPLRLRGQSAYGREVVQLQQNANAQNRHMVNPGETLSGIASRYGVSTRELAQANNMSVSAPLRMGQRLHIPQRNQQPAIDYTATASINRNAGDTSLQTASRQTPTPVIAAVPKAKPRWVREMASSARSTSSSQPKSQRVASLKNAVGLPDEATSPAPSQVKAAPVTPVSNQSNDAASAAKFRWPVRGRIISGFGGENAGVRNEGINLSVPEGTSIRAADNGTVIYAGDDLKMYGNFILVRHPNGWVTAYAHNNKLLVTKGQIVRRGQIIAEAGMSGNVGAPQLHFELRIKGDPVDPVPYLS